MPIINISNMMNNSQLPTPNSQLLTPNSQLPTLKFLKLRSWLLIGYCILVIGVLAGCIPKENLEQAQNYAKRTDLYYQRAVLAYKNLISQGKDGDRLRLELGKLYYRHGDFKEASGILKKISTFDAQKFLGLSYYRLGNFTDALEVFNKNESGDSEYLYYYGLTCEKLNLFDRALQVYKKISSGEFVLLASKRINIIEKEANLLKISDLDPEVGAIIASAPAAEKYPQAGALILLADEKFLVTPQNTQVSELHYIIKILNERGKESFSESHIDYDSTYEKVELEFARTIKPDGTVTEVGTRHIRDVSKYLNFPLYSNARVYIISFPEITDGALIEYKVKIYRSQLINKKDFILNYPLQSSEPVIAANFILEVPNSKSIGLKVLNADYNNFAASLKPDITTKDGRLIYAWRFKDIPQIIPESNMPPSTEINPTILISTFSSWGEIYNWWWDLAKDKIKADNAIKEKVKELIANQPSEEEKLRAIYNFCAKEIRYVAVEYGQAGYEPHPAPDIFRNKYGDCKDQAILLVAMLKEAGFSAWPLLIPTKEHYDLNPDFPSVLFNHCIAAVSFKGQTIFLDPTAETCSFGDLPVGDQKRKVLIIKENTYSIEDTPLYPAEHNSIKQILRMKIDNNEAVEADKDIFASGIYDQSQRFWLLYTPPELIEEQLKEKIQEFSIGAKLEKYSIKNLDDLNKPVVLNYSFNGPEYFTVAGKLRILPQLFGFDTSMVAKDKRKYAIDFSFLDSKETIVEIEIPDNFVIKYTPENINEDNPWLRFKAEYSRKGKILYCQEKTELKAPVVTQGQYPEFKKIFEGLAKKIKQRIVLERIK